MSELVYKLEYLYEELEAKTVYLIYALVVLIVAAVAAFLLSWPIIQNSQELQAQNAQTLQEIENINLTQFEAKLGQSEKQRLQLNTQLEQVRDQFLEYRSYQNSVDFMQYSNKNMTKFLDTIMQKSLQYDLDIVFVQNSPLQESDFVYAIAVSGMGSYGNITSYIHELLGFKAVISLQRFDIAKDEEQNVVFDLLFHFGGEL